ncbi:related to glycosidase CRR1 [Zygosaccharomyces bailii ISA1307]|nr:related to glycosidase CRR1 [Zygosaccharomyces bailii ISA1307]
MLFFASWRWLTSLFLVSGSILVYAELYKPEIFIKCSDKNQCPPEWPCCSPYGECGAGPVCLGGCNPKYSFDRLSCAPIPAILPPASINFAAKASKKATSDTAQEKVLNSHGITHFTNYLITKDKKEAAQMLEKYNFVYSGPVSMESTTGDIVLSMPRRSSGSLIAASQSFLYGKASVRMRTGRSRGVITAMVLISAVGDEIDYELLGSQREEVQSNYFSKGELVYTNMKRISLPSDSWANYHDYEIDWNEERIQWIVDGQIARTLRKDETWDKELQKYKYPHTPMRLEVALWPGGSEKNHPGTIEWAGGLIDWDNAPDMIEKGQFTAHLQQMQVVPHHNPFVPVMASCIRKGKKISYAYASEPGTDFNQNFLEWYCDMVPNVPGWTASGENIPRKEYLAATNWRREMIPVRFDKSFISDIRRLSFTPDGTMLFNTTKNDSWLHQKPSSSSASSTWHHINPIWKLLNLFRQLLEIV